MSTTFVNTKTVTGRRTLRFSGLDDILAEAERIAAAAHVRTLGNLSPGQIFKHLAIVMIGSIDGIPVRPPWFVRLIGRLIRNSVLTKGMKCGIQLPEDAKKVLMPADPIAPADGLAILRAAVNRLKTEPKREPSPFFGRMSEEDWVRLHCRHAELHFSFLIPE